jgi:TPR repeat protein
MKPSRPGLILALFCFASVVPTPAQDPLRDTLRMGFGDIAAIRKKAEAGDVESQRAFGDSLASNFRSADAMLWFRKAANQGNVEAAYRIGNMLLFGAPSIRFAARTLINAESIALTSSQHIDFSPNWLNP